MELRSTDQGEEMGLVDDGEQSTFVPEKARSPVLQEHTEGGERGERERGEAGTLARLWSFISFRAMGSWWRVSALRGCA